MFATKLAGSGFKMLAMAGVLGAGMVGATRPASAANWGFGLSLAVPIAQPVYVQQPVVVAQPVYVQPRVYVPAPVYLQQPVCVPAPVVTCSPVVVTPSCGPVFVPGPVFVGDRDRWTPEHRDRDFRGFNGRDGHDGRGFDGRDFRR